MDVLTLHTEEHSTYHLYRPLNESRVTEERVSPDIHNNYITRTAA
jgi:hypothetical protein